MVRAPGREARLNPNGFFDVWRTEARGRSKPWLECELDFASRLGRAILEVVVQRSREMAPAESGSEPQQSRTGRVCLYREPRSEITAARHRDLCPDGSSNERRRAYGEGPGADTEDRAACQPDGRNARVSSQEQAKEGFSIPAQDKLLRNYARERQASSH